MPDPSSPSARAMAICVAVLMVLVVATPAVSALDVSTKAIRVMGSSTYNPDTVQAYSGEVMETPDGLTGSGVAVAVLDTGVDNEHPTFEGAWVAGAERLPNGQWCERDPVDNEEPCDPDDANGHGTHVASTLLGRGAGAQGNGPTIPPGVAPGANLVEVKIADDLGNVDLGKVADGIQWVIDYNAGETDYGLPRHKVQVISLSVGSFQPKDGEDARNRDVAMAAIRDAHEAGILTVAAAGNCGPSEGGVSTALGCSAPSDERERNTITSPGAAPEAVTVGAIEDQDTVTRNGDTVASYSSRGPNPGKDTADEFWRKPDVVAPGTDIQAACHSEIGQSGRSNQLCTKSGTSMATPHVAGLAALIFQAGGQAKPDTGFTPDEVKKILRGTAEDIGDTGWDPISGYGYVDGYKAVVKALNQPPVPRFTVSEPCCQIGEEITFDASLTRDPDGQDSVDRLRWSFGDGSEPVENGAETLTATHAYTDPGLYTVELTVWDTRGTANTTQRSLEVEAPPPEDKGRPPEADLTWSPGSPRVTETVTLNASGTTDPDGHAIVRYEWDIDHVRGEFEADERTDDPTFSWQFDRSGPQDVALRVVDEEGFSDILVKTIQIRPPPPGPPVVEITNPQEGDRIEPGSLIVTWIVRENPVSSFTLFVDDREDTTLAARQVRLQVGPGNHTIRVVASGPGGQGTGWVNFTTPDQALEQASTDQGGDGCVVHTHDGTREEHCPEDQGEDGCVVHTHDGTSEEHCPEDQVGPNGSAGQGQAGEQSTKGAPMPPLGAIVAGLVASFLLSREPR